MSKNGLAKAMTSQKSDRVSFACTYFLCVVFCLVSLSACLPDFPAKRFAEAQKADRIDVYEKFLKTYPNSSFTENAIESIWRLTAKADKINHYESFVKNHPSSPFEQQAIEAIWRLTTKAGKINHYESFVKNHPSSPFEQQAIEAIWRLTTKADSVEAFENFLKTHPNSPFAQQAVEAIWPLTTKADEIKYYDSYVKNYPGSPFAQQAIESIWRLTTKADSTLAYARFIKKYPNSPFVQQAREMICPLFQKQKVDGLSGDIDPCISEGKNNDTPVHLKWDEVPGATSYDVYWVKDTSFDGNENKTNKIGLRITKPQTWHYVNHFPITYRVVALYEECPSQASEPVTIQKMEKGSCCEICGARNYGYCHMRNIFVCEKHRIFEQGGQTWQCP